MSRGRAEQLRKLVRGLAPPLILAAAREGRRRVRREPPEWEFVGRAWPAAPRTRQPRGWNEPSVARRYAAVWERYRAAADSTLPLSIVPEQAAGHDLAREPYDEYDVMFHNVTMTFAYALAQSARRRERLAVLDWGGATGHFYLLARALFPDLALDYAVKEVPETARVGRTLAPEVTFLDDDRPLDRAYDLVMASNSLQYAEDWRALLARLASASRGYVLLHQVPVVVRGGSLL